MAITRQVRPEASTAILKAAGEYARAVETQTNAAEDLAAAEATDAVGVTPDRLAALNKAHSEACDRLAAAELALKRAALYRAGSDPTLAD